MSTMEMKDTGTAEGEAAQGANGMRARRASSASSFQQRRSMSGNEFDIDGNPLEGEGARAQAVFVRADNEKSAMGTIERMQNRIANYFRKPLDDIQQQVGIPVNEDDMDENKGKQYRLAAARRGKASWYSRFCSMCCCRAQEQVNVYGLNPQKSLATYLHWMFRVNFFFLFCLSCVVFFALTFIFAGIIIGAGNMDPECVRIGGEEFGSDSQKFADAFALSWTTFSTVGYGSTYPALGHENSNPTNCLFITVICSLESFLGVLYSGFCGAILFGKVLRIQSHAQVLFSDPIVIRYGTGVENPGDADEKKLEEGTAGNTNIPCPVLEFRIVNRLFNETGGEIMDATLNCVANIDADDADPSIRDAAETDRLRYQHQESSKLSVEVNSTASASMHSTDSESIGSRAADKLKKMVPYLGSARRPDHQEFDEDPTAKLVSKRIFSKLLIEASDHPFFKRVWLARHVLDEHSPILTPKARKLIRRNKGFWPKSLNNYTGVRNSLQFNQILVSLNGVSNVSASDVYAQKIYDFVDMSVGYQFVNLLYRDEKDNCLKVDIDLINDVREQNGGGGEDLL